MKSSRMATGGRFPNEPDGVGTTPEMVARLLAGTAVEGKWREAVTGGKGHRNDLEPNDNIIRLRAQQGTSRAFTLARCGVLSTRKRRIAASGRI